MRRMIREETKRPTKALAVCYACLLLGALQVLGCGGGQESGSPPPPTQQLSISVSPTSVGLVQGGSAQTLTVTVTRTNVTSAVTLSVTNLSTGVTATITQPGTGNTGPIVLQASSTATLVTNLQISITAQATGVSDATTNFMLTVSAMAPGPGVTFTVNPAATRQTWLAWGAGEFADGPNFLVNNVCQSIPDSVLNAIVDDLVELGVNRTRIVQHQVQALEATSNDNADPFSLNMSAFLPGLEAPALGPAACPNRWHIDQIPRVIIPWRSKVLARGEPFEIYVSFVYDSASATPPWWQMNSEEMAEPFEAYWRWFFANWGFYPDFATWNEPDSSFFSPNLLGPWTKSGGDRLSALTGRSRPIAMPEYVTPGGAIGAWDTVVGTTGAVQRITRLSFHGYDYNSARWPDSTGISNRNALLNRAATAGVELSMSEICCKFVGTGAYSRGLDFVRDMYLNITEAQVSSWEALGFLGLCSTPGCPTNQSGEGIGVELETDLSTHYLQPNYWVQRQLMRYVRPGYVRVAVTCNGCTNTADRGPDLKALAWRRPNGTFVVNLVNDSGTVRSVTIAGLPSGVYDVHELDPTLCTAPSGKNRCAPLTTTVSVSGAHVLNTPIDAVWTLSQR